MAMVAMLFTELEGSTLEELIAAYRGPPLDGEEYRVVFYDSGFAVHRPAAAHACWTLVISRCVGSRP